MRHLRYLNLSRNSFTVLPVAICSLRNLQTLKLRYCFDLQKLSESISNLINLRYLDLYYCISLTQLPDGIGHLINLRHLDISNCERLTQLPDGMRQLIKLRYLDISKCGELRQLPVGMGHVICLQTLPLFIVDPESGRSIKELQGLNQFRGNLEIRGLEHVRDATEANLAAKQNLSSLSLIWEEISSNCQVVLEGLQPPQSLNNYLGIKGYGGSFFPSWMKLLQNLVYIKLTDCSNCEHLPQLGQLPLLKVLKMKRMESLKCIGGEFYGNSEGGFFPSLQELYIRWMPNLENWHALEEKKSQTFPCLKMLTLSECPKLVSLPFLILPCVQRLCIEDCEKLVVRSLPCLTSLTFVGKISFPEGSFQNLDALEFLQIRYCSEATVAIPKEVENLRTLTLYKIYYCDDMVSLQADGLLNSLEISRCNSLTAMGIQGLKSSLVNLEIDHCRCLTSLSECLQYLSALEKLHVRYCKQLEFSSGDFQHLITLKAISIVHLPKLTSLPEIQHLHALQTMEIDSCENLRVLPQGMQNLTSLRSLKIANCHANLHVQCKKDKGDYWPNISHIPSIEISYEVL